MTLKCEIRTYTEKSHTHHHSFNQLILPLQGKLMIKTDRHQLELDEQHLFFVPFQCSHSFHGSYRNEFLVLDIPNEIGQVSRIKGFNFEGLELLDEKWKSLRYLFLEEIKRQNKSALLNLAGYAVSLLGEEKMSASIGYIHDNLDKSLSLAQLALMENYSESYYTEWFRRYTGMTPNVYIQRLRMERAKLLLADTNKSLLTISEELGYQQQSSFTRLFKNHMHMSPNEYRRACPKMGKNKGV